MIKKITNAIKNVDWDNKYLRRRLETKEAHNYEKTDLVAGILLALGVVLGFAACVIIIAWFGTDFPLVWISVGVSFLLLAIITYVYFLQRNFKRMRVMFIFAIAIYFICVLAKLTDKEVVRFVTKLSGTDSAEVSKNAQLASSMVIYSLFNSLIVIEVITLLFVTFDQLWWRKFLSRDKKMSVKKEAIINLIAIVTFSLFVISGFSLLGNIAKPIISVKRFDPDTLSMLNGLSSGLWLLLSLIMIPIFAILGTINYDSAFGDNVNLKLIGFRLKVMIFFILPSNRTSNIMIYLQAAYVVVAVILTIAGLIAYFMKLKDKNAVPYQVSIFYAQIQNIEGNIAEKSKDELKQLGLKKKRTPIFKKWDE